MQTIWAVETSTPYKTCWQCRVNGERPTGKKKTTTEWDDGGKINNKNKLILTDIFPLVHETWYLETLTFYVWFFKTKLKSIGEI